MAYTVLYASAGIAFIFIILLFLAPSIHQFVVDDSRLIATPSIRKENAILTSFASKRIHAPVDEVFAALVNFKDYSKWSGFSEYKWHEVAPDGTPLVGSHGSFRLSVDGFSTQYLQTKLTVLDRERKMIAEKTRTYPDWLLSSERVQEVVPVEGHPKLCEYRTWHTFEGVAAYFLLVSAQEELAETQRSSAEGLKAYMESEHPKPS